jgi:hypothetical protein
MTQVTEKKKGPPPLTTVKREAPKKEKQVIATCVNGKWEVSFVRPKGTFITPKDVQTVQRTIETTFRAERRMARRTRIQEEIREKKG